MSALDGSIALVTGSGHGIGLATARALCRAGARVALGDIDEDAAKAAAAGIGAAAVARHLDVADAASYRDFIHWAEELLGPIDVLINNAGIMPIGPFLSESDAVTRRILHVNVIGALTGMRAVLPAMISRGQGHIVNVASVAGRSPAPGGLTYAASKAAIVSATETARVEYAGTGVRFTCVMPSFTATDLIVGTKDLRLIPPVSAEAVACAVVRGIIHEQKDVFVPALVGFMVRGTPLLGRRIRDAMGRAFGTDRSFLSVDRAARADYDARIEAQTSTTTTTTPTTTSEPPTFMGA
jgi:NAD(P)-dependent dehydrogenase (short-subunit alcohol dehydrogenase family)